MEAAATKLGYGGDCTRYLQLRYRVVLRTLLSAFIEHLHKLGLSIGTNLNHGRNTEGRRMKLMGWYV